MVWEKNYGGADQEAIEDFRRNSDGSYIVGAYTNSNNTGDVPPNFGQNDNWVFKLVCDFTIPDMTDDEICAGESIDLTATPVDCTTCTYQWGSNASNATDKTITVSPTVTTHYSVTVTNGTCCSDTTSLTIVVHPVPEVDLGPDMDLCPGDTISFDVTSPLAGCTYAWSTGSTNPTIDITNPGTYSVTTTCTGNCLSLIHI